MSRKFYQQTFLVILFIVFGIIIRVFSHFKILPALPNFSPIAALALFSGVYLKKKYSLLVPLGAMMLSDAFIGFHNLIAFTWGSFLLVGAIGWYVKKNKSLTAILGGGLLGSILFYLVTNWAVWAFTPLYAKDLIGLGQSYFMAIPFFRNTLLGDLFYVGVFFGLYEIIKVWAKKREKLIPEVIIRRK